MSIFSLPIKQHKFVFQMCAEATYLIISLAKVKTIKYLEIIRGCQSKLPVIPRMGKQIITEE